MNVWRPSFAIACLAIMALLGIADARADDRCAPGYRGVPVAITKVTLRVLQHSIVPVPATDGFIHLAYAAQATNVDPLEAIIEHVVPVDADRGFKPTGSNSVVDINDRNITGKVRPFKPPYADAMITPPMVDTNRLRGGESGIMFFDLRYKQRSDVPLELSHRLDVAFPNGPRATELTNPIPVGCDEPVVLSPPLIGHRWWNGNGCCHIVGPHRGATLPINGSIEPPEQLRSTSFSSAQAVTVAQARSKTSHPGRSSGHPSSRRPTAWWSKG